MKRRRGAISPPSTHSPSLFDLPSAAPEAAQAVELSCASMPALPEIYERGRRDLSRREPRLGDLRLDAHADGQGHRRGRVHPALGARRDQRLQVAPQRPLVLLPARPHVAAASASCGRAISAAFPPRPTTACRSPRSGSSASTRRAARCSSPCAAWRRKATACGARRSSSRACASRRDGLLAPERKRTLPRYPRRIAFVTSASGAALHDVIAVLRRRAPGVELVVVPRGGAGRGRAARAVRRARSRVPLGRRRARDHRARRRLARRSLGVQRRARRARRRGVSRADHLGGRPRGRRHALRPRRRPARGHALGRRRGRGAVTRRDAAHARRSAAAARIGDRELSVRAARPRDARVARAGRTRCRAVSPSRQTRARECRRPAATPSALWRRSSAATRWRAAPTADRSRRCATFAEGARSTLRLRDGEVDATVDVGCDAAATDRVVTLDETLRGSRRSSRASTRSGWSSATRSRCSRRASGICATRPVRCTKRKRA